MTKKQALRRNRKEFIMSCWGILISKIPFIVRIWAIMAQYAAYNAETKRVKAYRVYEIQD
jgi:hypothetical protein